MTRAIKGVLTILTSLALGALIVAGALVAKAKAQSRYDTDQQWIRGTLREERKARREREEAREERERAAERWARERQRDLERERWARTHDRYYGYRSADSHPETRVYGFVARRGFTERDATSHVGCYPQVQGLSAEHLGEEAAWGDAQRDWANKVRWQAGERFMDLRYAVAVEKQCTISSVKESVLGRITQGAKEIVGGDAVGARWRCMVRAAPCQAPIEGDPNIKGDSR